MSLHPRIHAYLDAATRPLTGDEELRLDIRAELAAHLEDTAAGFEGEGHTPEASVDLAIQSIGPATDYAADLMAANRARMRWRSRSRLFLRALIVPAALVAALVSLSVAFISPLALVRMVGNSPEAFEMAPPSWLQHLGRHRLSRDEHLIVYGDPTRHDPVAAQRAIWEAWPNRLVYLNNYLTALYSRYDQLGATPADCFGTLERELRPALALDPTNARYHYLLADKMLARAATVETIDKGKDAKGNTVCDYRLAVKDRVLLDRAMAELQAGIHLPALRRYATDMLTERLAILGPPHRLAEQVEQTGIAAGVLLPDLATYRNLTRASIGYARLLIEEGHPDAARPFIDTWQTLSRQLTDDSFTLIDVLVAGALGRIGQDSAVRLYQAMGDAQAADRTLQAATAFNAPVTAYRTRVKATEVPERDQQRLITRKAGILSNLLLPALGESVTEAELAPSRLVEYVLLDQATCSLASLLLLVLMAGALGVVLRWRATPGAAGAPLLLLPDSRQALHVVAGGVLLPLAVYTAWTCLPLPSFGRGESLGTTWPIAVTQALILVEAIVVLTTCLVIRHTRTRCVTLGVEVPERHPRRIPWLGIALLAPLGLGVCSALLAHSVMESSGTGEHPAFPPVVGAGLVGFIAVLAGTGLTAWGRAMLASRRLGLYYGTVARTLIPYLAMASVCLTLLTYPYLRLRESNLISTDPLMSTPTSSMAAGFTRPEARLVERLKHEMQEACRGQDTAGRAPHAPAAPTTLGQHESNR